jgi:hypothetical protein
MDVPVVLDHVSPVQKRPVASLDQAFVHQARLRVQGAAIVGLCFVLLLAPAKD